MKFFKIALVGIGTAAVALPGGGCSSETDTKQPKVQGPVDNRLKGGPVGRTPPGGGPAQKGGGGATTAGGLNKN